MSADDEVIEMTSETVAGDLLKGILQELRLLPDIWPKLSEDEQQAIIDRCRERVTRNVREAVKLIASAGRVTVVGDLKKVSLADKVEAVFALPMRDPALADLCEARGKACLIVVANSGEHMGGVDDVLVDPRQMQLPNVGPDTDAGSIIEQARRRSKKDKTDDDQGEASQEGE
ncbi:conserved protein of unknown function [Cupriavidus taiwanensis]|uniref:Uncharacterized protein n=1 Tax=Cupriavidus taiwanensis TaxID=164546 RepID=A0A375IJU7_9BURK|nr:hypothetical protein [Cupriavidus taiwanensis]SPK73692.1 conserved protein of unknown function [Cupriavidus taiwanensis]